MRNQPVRVLHFLVLGLALVVCNAPASAQQEKSSSSQGVSGGSEERPNIIWICLDALRAKSMSCYGYERPTSPELDRFAQEGVLFDNHYTQALWTTLSVPQYMTGRYFAAPVHQPPESEKEEPGAHEPSPNEILFPRIAAANGYHTVLISAHPWFTPESPLGKAFDEVLFLQSERGQAYVPVSMIVPAVEQWLSKSSAKPFFLYVHVMDTHFPHRLNPPYDGWMTSDRNSEYIDFKKGQPSKNRGCKFTPNDQANLRGMYDGGIQYTDNYVGEMLGYISGLGILDRSIVIVGSDHGDSLGEDGTAWGHLGYPYDCQLRVPLIMAGPGIPKNKRIPQLTQNVDIVPTLTEMLGFKGSFEFDGKSLVSLFADGSPAQMHPYVVCYYTAGAGGKSFPVFVAANGQFKYVLNRAQKTETLYQTPDPSGLLSDVTGKETKALDEAKAYFSQKVQPIYETRVNNTQGNTNETPDTSPENANQSKDLPANQSESDGQADREEQLKALGYLE